LSVMATITLKNVLRIVENRAIVAELFRDAVAIHADAINAETSTFDTVRANDSEYWARLTMIKAILSPGCNLDKNISAAHVIHAAMMAGLQAPTFDDIKELLATVAYGTAAYGNNVRALIGSWQTIRNANESIMTWDGLQALSEAKVLFGQGDKARSWNLALYDASSAVITLDRHMLRGIATACGITVAAGDLSIGKPAYAMLVTLILDILAVELNGAYSPLCAQWSLWNEIRHPGVHASHIALAG